MKKFWLISIFWGMMVFAQSVCFAENWEYVESYGMDMVDKCYLDLDSCYLLPDSYFGKVCNAYVRIETANEEAYEEWNIHFSNQRRVMILSVYAYDADGNETAKTIPYRKWLWLKNDKPFFKVYQVAWMNAYER